jgi:hypothetical protein
LTCRARRVIDLDDLRSETLAIEFECDVTIDFGQLDVDRDPRTYALTAYRGANSSPDDVAAHKDWAILGLFFYDEYPDVYRVLTRLQAAQDSRAPALWLLTHAASQRS